MKRFAIASALLVVSLAAADAESMPGTALVAVDGNGVLTRSEFDAELRKEFNLVDKDEDGVLD